MATLRSIGGKCRAFFGGNEFLHHRFNNRYWCCKKSKRPFYASYSNNNRGILVSPTLSNLELHQASQCLEEAERKMQCNGRVFCLDDEPGVHRVWLPDEEVPGLEMSRAFGDFCIKDFRLISVPEVTKNSITTKDQFIVLATDGNQCVNSEKIHYSGTVNDVKAVVTDVMKIIGVLGVQNLHVRSLTNTDVINTLHLQISSEID